VFWQAVVADICASCQALSEYSSWSQCQCLIIICKLRCACGCNCCRRTKSASSYKEHLTASLAAGTTRSRSSTSKSKAPSGSLGSGSRGSSTSGSSSGLQDASAAEQEGSRDLQSELMAAAGSADEGCDGHKAVPAATAGSEEGYSEELTGSPSNRKQAAAAKQGGKRPSAGGVPDFKALHEKWDAQQAEKKAASLKRLTTPEVGAADTAH